MAVAVFKSPIEVDKRLSELHVHRDQLLLIVEAMVGAKAACTENDPPSARGWSAWRHGIRRSREVFRPAGWLKDDTDQLSCIVNHSLGMRLAVANTDDETGNEAVWAIPQNRSKKGAATDRAIDGTQQTLFAPGAIPSVEGSVVRFMPRERHSTSYVTYYVCVFNEGEVVRAEFSCPVAVENGFFVGFSERIILIGPGDWPLRPKGSREDPAGSGTEEFDIPVRRK